MSAYIQFGAGKLFVNPNAGNLATNPTPVQGLTIQDVSIDISGEIKELKGGSQFPDDTAVADKKGSGKFAIGRKDLALFNNVFFADTVATGITTVSPNEAHSVPGTSTYTVTVTGSATFSTDLGVTYAVTGKAFTKVSSLTAAGQYTVSAGVYTFHSSDASAAVLISYAYALSATGATYQVNNQALGYGPQCEIYLVDQYQPVSGVYNVIRLYAAKINKITIGNKRADYSIPEVDFSFFQAASGRVIDMYSVNG